MESQREHYGLGITNCRTSESVVSGVMEAEQLGAEIAFIAEDINCRDAFQLCALAAGQTEHIRLATGVVNPYTRNPTSLAMAAATLDEVSHGRAVLGIGSSSPSLIEGQMGISAGGAPGRMRECTEIIRGLLAGEEVTTAGKHFSYMNARLQVKSVQDRLPIFFGAMGPRMLRLAGSVADGVLLNVSATVEYVRWAVQEITDAAVGAGRDPSEVTIAGWLTVYSSNDRSDSIRRSREWLATMLCVPRQGELLLEHAGVDPSLLNGIREFVTAYPHGGDRGEAAQLVPAELAERMTLIGNAEEIRSRLQAYREAGLQLPVLSIGALRALYGSGEPASS
ncbi:MAG: LLM class flavin-dependent oxidoreductase [Chloroflexota bacterium]